MPSINGSVGQGGLNKPEDVLIVQKLLNKHRLVKLAEDKKCGPSTIQAIIAFQKGFLSTPDGRVDPGGTTWKRLTNTVGNTAVVTLVQLPQVCGYGYYSYEPANRQFGTAATINALQEVAQTFLFNLPNVAIGIGDISFSKGGPMSPHKAHQHGTNVDIRPFRTDRAPEKVTITDPQYDREMTRLLVQSLLAHRNVKSILFNDTRIQGVHYYQGHHNHMHVTMKA
jgi:penicillin-insensitive murein endopeptidase